LAAADSPKPTPALGGVRLVVARLARLYILVLLALVDRARVRCPASGFV